ncbi:uncharacterized [Tachysurus ichikawai]
MEHVQRGSAACSKATNKHRAKASASHRHCWAALELHRGHLWTFHLLTKELLPPLKKPLSFPDFQYEFCGRMAYGEQRQDRKGSRDPRPRL